MVILEMSRTNLPCPTHGCSTLQVQSRKTKCISFSSTNSPYLNMFLLFFYYYLFTLPTSSFTVLEICKYECILYMFYYMAVMFCWSVRKMAHSDWLIDTFREVCTNPVQTSLKTHSNRTFKTITKTQILAM